MYKNKGQRINKNNKKRIYMRKIINIVLIKLKCFGFILFYFGFN